VSSLNTSLTSEIASTLRAEVAQKLRATVVFSQQDETFLTDTARLAIDPPRLLEQPAKRGGRKGIAFREAENRATNWRAKKNPLESQQ
jgi:hypothetical protein